MHKLTPIHFCVSFLTLAVSTNLFAKETILSNVVTKQEIKHDTSMPLRYMQAKTNLLHPQPSIKHTLATEFAPPKLAQSLVPLTGFQGLGMGLGNYQVTSAVANPSTSVGMTQYVQWVNSDIGVFDKTTGQLAAGFPKPGNAIWAGFGGLCETTNVGQQTVKYDELAGRWVLSQAAYDNNNGPFYQCVAVSTTEDATGSYNRYAFQVDSLIDYARLGLWPDAYYLALLLKGPNQTGPVACALDRPKMLQGQAATMQCLSLAPAFVGPLLPVNLDGSQSPPVGNPGYIVGLDAPFNLMMGKFYVDFTTPANTNLTLFSLPVAQYKPACESTNGNACAIQPNTTNRLHVLSDRLLSKFIYRQFKDYGSMVVTHTVEGPAPEKAPAIRWYELRLYPTNPNHNPVVYQQSTIAPDSMNRFMGAISIDRFTNIAIGYTVTSSLIYPSLEMAYHNYNDQNNKMTIQPLFTGKASQIDNVSDWGLRSNMSIDPVDQCTFYYTNEYLSSPGSFNWSTFVVKIKLASCK